MLIIGEDALANLSVEKDESGKITGHVRIRSKGQGMALSLGQVVVR
jgi:coatomer subunit beta